MVSLAASCLLQFLDKFASKHLRHCRSHRVAVRRSSLTHLNSTRSRFRRNERGYFSLDIISPRAEFFSSVFRVAVDRIDGFHDVRMAERYFV
jgi:hypothetical protein